MEKLLKDLKSAAEKSKKKVTGLAEQIQADKAKVVSLDKEYQKHIIAGDDLKADELFNEIQEKKNEIAKNVAKYKVLNSGKVPHEVEKIVKDIEAESKKERDRLLQLETKKNAELEEIRELFFLKIEELGEIIREEKKNNANRTRAMKHIDPSVPYLPEGYYDNRMKVYEFKIDKEQLIYQALQGTRTKGVTR